MWLLVILFILPCTDVFCIPPHPNIPSAEEPKQPVNIDNKNKQVPEITLKAKNAEVPVITLDSKEIKKTDNASVSNSTDPNKNFFQNKLTDMDSGAVVRGVWVFVGLSLLFMLYLGFQTYRKRNRRHCVVKKYGVRTRRTDVEMEPLPLDEDEDDETVFDLGNVSRNQYS